MESSAESSTLTVLLRAALLAGLRLPECSVLRGVRWRVCAWRVGGHVSWMLGLRAQLLDAVCQQHFLCLPSPCNNIVRGWVSHSFLVARTHLRKPAMSCRHRASVSRGCASGTVHALLICGSCCSTSGSSASACCKHGGKGWCPTARNRPDDLRVHELRLPDRPSVPGT